MVTKEEIRKNIQIIALNNLIEDYTSFLEVCKNSQERELTENIINMLKEKIKSGITNVNELVTIGEKNILTEKSTKVDYLKIVDINTMEDVVEVDRNVLIALAVYINEKVRLIDNIEIIKE